MSSRTSRRRLLSSVRTTLLTSPGSNFIGWFLLNASRLRVISDARSTQAMISSTSALHIGSFPLCIFRSVAQPRMIVSRLLKSRATLPAIVPRASIFCEWRSSSSVLRCSVMSVDRQEQVAHREHGDLDDALFPVLAGDMVFASGVVDFTGAGDWGIGMYTPRFANGADLPVADPVEWTRPPPRGRAALSAASRTGKFPA